MRSFAVAPRAAAVAVPKIQSFQAVRFYSAGGALNKDEVEGRIISLLQGFDKVSYVRGERLGGRKSLEEAISPSNCRLNYVLRR
jgi:hypothetical protein